MTATVAKRLSPANELIKAGALTPTGLRLDKLGKTLTYNRCEALAAFLGSLRDSTAWALGDLLVYVEIAFGENEMHQLAESTGRSPEQLGQYMRVSAKVSAQQRNPALSWTHHRHVAKLAPDDQSYWLSKAEEKRWTSGELWEQVRTDSGSRTGNEGGSEGGGSGSVVVEELEKAARAVWRAGNPDGNGFVLVPVDTWARFGSALGLE